MSDMEFSYQCSDPDSSEKSWSGHIRPLNININEFEVTARGSTFHLLVGKHSYGKYLCIPNWVSFSLLGLSPNKNKKKR